MTNCGVILRTIACVVTVTISMMSMAAGVHKWVDSDGNVHYSETRPKQQDSSKIPTSPSGAQSADELPQDKSIRGADGNCLTVKCMADEMEANRLRREAEYARQSEENDRLRELHLRKTQNPREHPVYNDTYMRARCLHGMCEDIRDCEDVKQLRQCAAAYAEQEERKAKRSRSERERQVK